MSSGKVLVILGSTRDGRQGLRVAKMMVESLSKQGLIPTLIDPLEIDPPVLRQPLHFRSAEQQASSPAWMHDMKDKITKTDGLVIVSAEYNATIPPALSNLLDHFAPADFRHKPVSIATYSMGSFGGVRARAALLPFVSELGMLILPSTVVIPSIRSAGIDENGKTDNERIVNNVEKLCKELDWYISAQKTQKEKSGAFPN